MLAKTNFELAEKCGVDVRTINRIAKELNINMSRKVTQTGRGGHNKNEFMLTDEEVTLICMSTPNNDKTVSLKVDFINSFYGNNGAN